MELSPEKRPDPEAAGGGGGFAGALTGFLADSDEEGGLSPELPIEEELVEKVMHELYEEIAGRNDSTGVPAAPQRPPPPTFVEEEGKNGNCGASVSETASTVMAGVHFACCAGELSSRPSPSLPPSGGGEASGEADGDGGGGGGDGVEMDDEWLEKALSWVPLMEGLGGY